MLGKLASGLHLDDAAEVCGHRQYDSVGVELVAGHDAARGSTEQNDDVLADRSLTFLGADHRRCQIADARKCVVDVE